MAEQSFGGDREVYAGDTRQIGEADGYNTVPGMSNLLLTTFSASLGLIMLSGKSRCRVQRVRILARGCRLTFLVSGDTSC